jgi:hypothetical protein
MLNWHFITRTEATHTFIATRRLPIFVLGNIAEAMQVPFPELKYLELMPHDKGPSVLSDTFLDGIRPAFANALGWILCLQRALLILLLSDNNLRLLNIQNSGYLPPEVMVACVSVMTEARKFFDRPGPNGPTSASASDDTTAPFLPIFDSKGLANASRIRG